jgi:hypothetical protein
MEGLVRIRSRIADGLLGAQGKHPQHLDRIAKHRWLAQRFNLALQSESYDTGVSPISV